MEIFKKQLRNQYLFQTLFSVNCPGYEKEMLLVILLYKGRNNIRCRCTQIDAICATVVVDFFLNHINE